MATPRRIMVPNYSYHIYNKCLNHEDMLKFDGFKELFLKVIAMAQEKYDFELNNYSILDNHFHLVITTKNKDDTIARIMQYIKSVFTKKYNKAVGRSGTIWNSRYGDTIIDISNNPQQYGIWLHFYIAYNPVRKKYTDNPRKYPFNSINHYLGQQESIVTITEDRFFLSLGDTQKDRLEKYLAVEQEYICYLF